METEDTVGGYLIHQLYKHGVHHVFGVTGDYVLGFYDQLSRSEIAVINTCDEQGAGFAADAYARVRGLGTVCVTYGVGALKVVNTTAQAFAEKSPVVVISGSPGTKEREKNPLLHHKVRDFDTQHKVFEQITVASAVLNDAKTALPEIDRVLSAALRYKRPVYIELPRDIVTVPVARDHTISEIQNKSDPDALREALEEAITMINAAKKPVIIAGEELQRFGLQDELLLLVAKTNIPVAATILSKSVISEYHFLYLGVYEGAIGREDVREYIESSDCLILLGALLSDITLGMFTAKIDQAKSIYATSEQLSISYHDYKNVHLKDFLQGLIDADINRRRRKDIPGPKVPRPFSAVRGQKITIQRLFQRLNAFLTNKIIVVADVGDALYGGLDLVIHQGTEFLCPAYYASLGFAVPAGIGAQLANPNLRPLVLVGDGAFQMTGMELSVAARFHLNPIVVVLNNSGYGTERALLDGPFNDLQQWQYSHIPEVIGAGRGFVIETEEQLDDALLEAQEYTKDFCIFDVRLDVNDRSPALQRMTSRLAKRVV
jgi:indolepyruvate decarboxylase